MTYENMIQWAIDEGLDFDGFIEEFGEEFRFLEKDYPKTTSSRISEVSRPVEVLPSPIPELEGRVSDIVTSFINFFRGK